MCVQVDLSVIVGVDIAAAHSCHLGDPSLEDHHGDHVLPRCTHTRAQIHICCLFD